MSREEQDASQNRAAAYVRMSTEHQQYSTSNQMDVIREYAKRRGLEIVKEYSDEGKSGLNIQGRDSLAQMIRDVQDGEVNFSNILVYDVSRWGRFQDADESAYYEYTCRRSGVAVNYCAEQFENDGSPVSTIVKGVKRAMAGEYSRELSSKVFQGACRLIQLGYKQGGAAGFGLRRMLIDQNGQRKTMLKIGEQKSIQTDRVILVRGPDEEGKIVRWIYRLFIDDGKNESEIADSLNAKGVATDFGRAWTCCTVHQILTNEKYIGNNVYHRTSFKLKHKHVENPPDKWVRANGVFEGIIEPELFFKAREIILARSQKLTDEEMLEKLRGLLSQHGHISGILIDETESLPSSTAFRYRFGSLKAIRLLKRVSGVRQIEIAELMVAANNYFTGYAEALVLGTPKDQLVNPDEPKKKQGMSAEDIARMEREMESLERDLKTVSDNYGESMFTLTTAHTYIKNLLKNAKVVRYLNANHSEISAEFETIAATESI